MEHKPEVEKGKSEHEKETPEVRDSHLKKMPRGAPREVKRHRALPAFRNPATKDPGETAHSGCALTLPRALRGMRAEGGSSV